MWPKLEENIIKILNEEKIDKIERTDRDIIEELLEKTRTLSKQYDTLIQAHQSSIALYLADHDIEIISNLIRELLYFIQIVLKKEETEEISFIEIKAHLRILSLNMMNVIGSLSCCLNEERSAGMTTLGTDLALVLEKLCQFPSDL